MLWQCSMLNSMICYFFILCNHLILYSNVELCNLILFHIRRNTLYCSKLNSIIWYCSTYVKHSDLLLFQVKHNDLVMFHMHAMIWYGSILHVIIWYCPNWNTMIWYCSISNSMIWNCFILNLMICYWLTVPYYYT